MTASLGATDLPPRRALTRGAAPASAPDLGATGHPRALIFDLDGTLVDSLPSVAAAMAAAFQLHGFAIAAADLVPLIGPPMDVLVEHVTSCSRAVAARVDAEVAESARLYGNMTGVLPARASLFSVRPEPVEGRVPCTERSMEPDRARVISPRGESSKHATGRPAERMAVCMRPSTGSGRAEEEGDALHTLDEVGALLLGGVTLAAGR